MSAVTSTGTLMTLATTEETRTTIDALLSLGEDLLLGEDHEQTENEILQPIAPKRNLPNPTPFVSTIEQDDNETIEDQTDLKEKENKTQPQMEEKPKPKKGRLVVQNFQLAQNQKPERKFACVGCPMKFGSNKELGDHFKSTHPPLTCSDCNALFTMPCAFKKHKYKHYEYMFECDRCDKGFHFESKLKAHKRKHIADQGLACFHANCGKCFKCLSELNAHLKSHTGEIIQCEYCKYYNNDIRNVRAHTHIHLNVQSFSCSKCGNKFKWGSQKKRHIESGKCNP